MQRSEPPPKLGLALSGGGFRAAFFHVGVLARMAELGILRRVEVLSTVSGGSIVGALYYMYVRDLLQTKPEEQVTDDDYARIVEHVARVLREGVETNVRGRTFRRLDKNFRMARRSYSRSERLGELYDETFYRRAWNRPLFGDRPGRERTTMVEMRELLIVPPGETEDYSPTRQRRSYAPVPILVVNATSLNTGHNWRFEAVGMGEPDSAPGEPPAPQRDPREDARREIDRNTRLSWARYEDLPANKRNIEVGIAVAASSCVPTLFHPLPIVDLYRLDAGGERRPITVELVDGGVHDNQGVASLIEFECDLLVVSDASGYLPDQEAPATRIPAVLGRTIGIYGDRVREEQLLNARLDEAERPMGLAHLRKGIIGYAVAPLGANGEPLHEPRREPPDDFRGERFDVAEEVQKALSRVRTDLDAFSEVEAFSLMLDGYRMAGPNLEVPELRALGTPVTTTHEWEFQAVGDAAKAGAPAEYLRHLRVANSRFFRSIALSTEGKLLAAGVALVGVVALALLLLLEGVRDAFSVELRLWWVLLGVAAAGFLAFLYLNDKFARRLSDFLYTQLLVALMAIPLWLSSWLVLLFSRIFVRAGRVKNVLR